MATYSCQINNDLIQLVQTHCNLILVVQIFCSYKNCLSNFTSVLQWVDMCPCMYVDRLLQLSCYCHIKVQTDISKSSTLKVFTDQCVQNISSIKIGANCTFVNTDEISLAHVAHPECFGQPQPSSGKIHETWKVTVALLHNVLICTKDADIQRNTNY